MRGIYALLWAAIIIVASANQAAACVSGNDAAVDWEQNVRPAEVAEPLWIDSGTLYEDMDKTYGQGYLPKTENGRVIIVLPLLGKTYYEKVSITADLGTTQNSPFVFGNYSQAAGAQNGAYIFRLEIPLAKERINGSYPVILKADYLDINGNRAEQSFTVYVTITDGVDAATGSIEEAAETPKLYISACEVTPKIVSGGETFSVAVTIENLGAARARSVILTYGSDADGIVPSLTNNTMHLEDISSGKEETISLSFRTTADVIAGEQPFYVKLDYTDLYGGIYTEEHTFPVRVLQPAKMEYDPLRIPKQVISGETVSVPVQVFNTGKSTLRNVTVSISGSGLIATSGAFFGDILPGESGNGELKFYVGILSMTDNTADAYGKSNGTCTITYTDDNGEEHKEETDFSTEIIQPAEASQDIAEEKTVGQWWISILVTFAVIAITVSSMVVTRFSRMMRYHS